MIAAVCRLRKHSDYQRVYAGSRRQFSRQMSYFFLLRAQPDAAVVHGRPGDAAVGDGARVGLTVGKAMGKAVERNRIKRRMREAVHAQLALLTAPVDVVLHPRRSTIDCEFAVLEREVATVFRAIDKAARRQTASVAQDPHDGRSAEAQPCSVDSVPCL